MLDFAFPLKVWSGVEPRAAGAVEAFESTFRNAWGDRDRLHRFGFFSPRGGRQGMEADAASGYQRFNKRIGALMAKPREGNPPRYIFRESTLLPSGAVNHGAGVRIFQQAYLRELRVIRTQRDITTYPDAPIANLVVAVIPGRIVGHYSTNLETRHFVSEPRYPQSPALLDSLNSQLSGPLYELWGMNFDVFGGNRYDRSDTPGMMTRKYSNIPDAMACLEPIFCATLFHSEFLNASLWSGDASRPRPSELRLREHAMGFVPCGPFSLVILSYPTANVFDRRGPLQETHTRPDIVEWIITYCAFLAADPNNLDAPNSDTRPDLKSYLAAVGQTRHRPVYTNKRSSTLETIYTDFLGAYMTESSTNQPVLPLEAALRAIER